MASVAEANAYFAEFFDRPQQNTAASAQPTAPSAPPRSLTATEVNELRRQAALLLPERVKEIFLRDANTLIANANALGVDTNSFAFQAQLTALFRRSANDAARAARLIENRLFDAQQILNFGQADGRFANATTPLDVEQAVRQIIRSGNRTVTANGQVSSLADWLDRFTANTIKNTLADRMRDDERGPRYKVIIHGDMAKCLSKNSIDWWCENVRAMVEALGHGERPPHWFHSNCHCEVVPLWKNARNAHITVASIVQQILNPLPRSQWGTITIPEGLRIEAHELETSNRLARVGIDVVWRPLTHGHQVSNPDVYIDGNIWELKSPTGSGKNNTSEQFKAARRQGVHRLVIDAARSPLNEADVIDEMIRRLSGSEVFVELMHISRTGAVTRIRKT